MPKKLNICIVQGGFFYFLGGFLYFLGAILIKTFKNTLRRSGDELAGANVG